MPKDRDKNPPIIEDAHLWEYVAKETKPLDKKVRRKKEKTTHPTIELDSVSNHKNFLPPALSAQKEIIEGSVANVDRSTATKLKTGKYPVDLVLDLHGKTQEQAHQYVVDTIMRAYTLGKRCILIITGKGRATGSEGVLKKQLPIWTFFRSSLEEVD
jgi:DNA-nicking Smr family endonuclease